MKAYRLFNDGVVREITVDLDLNGNPILPPGSTVDPKPEAAEGYFVTIRDNKWVQEPIYVPAEPSLEQKKAEALQRVSAWKDNILEQPVTFEGVLFDGDEVARARLTQAVLLVEIGAPHPEVWIDFNNQAFPIPTADVLKSLSMTVAAKWQMRFYKCVELRETILAMPTKEALEAQMNDWFGDGMEGGSLEDPAEPRPELPEEGEEETPITPEGGETEEPELPEGEEEV